MLTAAEGPAQGGGQLVAAARRGVDDHDQGVQMGGGLGPEFAVGGFDSQPLWHRRREVVLQRKLIACRELHARSTRGGQQQRRMRSGVRRRLDGHLLRCAGPQLQEATRARPRLVVPPGEVDIEYLEIAPVAATPQSEVESPAAELVEQRRLLGQFDRMAQRRGPPRCPPGSAGCGRAESPLWSVRWG